ERLDALVGVEGTQRADALRLPQLGAVLGAALGELGMLHVAVEELEIVSERQLGEDLPEDVRMDVDVAVAVQCFARKGVGRRLVCRCRRAPGRHRSRSPSRSSLVAAQSERNV